MNFLDRSCPLLLGLWLCLTPCFAQGVIALPQGGQPLLPEDSSGSLRFSGSAFGRGQLVDVEGAPFSRAMRVEITRQTQQAWDVQVLATTDGDIEAGDTLLMNLWVRGSGNSETGEATGTAYLQRRGGDFAKFISLSLSAGGEWKQYVVPVQVNATLPSGQHEFAFHLGSSPQIIEVGGLQILNYKRTRTIADLPRSRVTWPGMEADAPWRAEAAERIDAIRKAPLRIVVVDGEGSSVAGAKVRVRQKRHEFGFGIAVAADQLAASTQDGERYREIVKTWFNKTVLENDLKWPNWDANRGRALRALSWLRENDIPVRGHTLVWPGWRYMPADVQQISGNADALRARVHNHIVDEVSATSGQIVEWDVLNEPYSNTELQKILGDEEMVEWFRLTREHDPNALLYINDYGVLTNGGNDKAHEDHYFTTIGKLIEWGAPLDGIGIQGHFGALLTSTPKIWQILDRFAVYGKRIQITEFDINMDDEEAQAAYTRDFLRAIFAHPSIDGFLMWGFWEGRHWLPKAAMFRRDWSMKPMAVAFYDTVYREFWTDVEGETNADGVLQVRGFKGDYNLEAEAGERRDAGSITLTGSGTEVVLTVR
jgi:endo-1,4-beta-xylanase